MQAAREIRAEVGKSSCQSRSTSASSSPQLSAAELQDHVQLGRPPLIRPPPGLGEAEAEDDRLSFDAVEALVKSVAAAGMSPPGLEEREELTSMSRFRDQIEKLGPNSLPLLSTPLGETDFASWSEGTGVGNEDEYVLSMGCYPDDVMKANMVANCRAEAVWQESIRLAVEDACGFGADMGAGCHADTMWPESIGSAFDDECGFGADISVGCHADTMWPESNGLAFDDVCGFGADIVAAYQVDTTGQEGTGEDECGFRANMVVEGHADSIWLESAGLAFGDECGLGALAGYHAETMWGVDNFLCDIPASQNVSASEAFMLSPPSSTLATDPRPQLGSPEFPTLGSGEHHSGQCKPCAFVHRKEGCGNSTLCQFCHLCLPGEKKRRKVDRALATRMGADGIQAEYRWPGHSHLVPR